jgi:hypothetical protein
MHSIPGRIRLVLSHPPKNFAEMNRSVKGHAGILSFTYTPVTRSALIRYDGREVREQEIIIRLALALSRDYHLTPVRVLSKPEEREMSGWAVVSGMILTAALVNRVFNRSGSARTVFGWLSLIGVAGAVVEHAWSEVNRRGSFDPEVLSIVYLFSAIPRRNLLPASLFTWITTFGRHLIRTPVEGLELRAVELKGTGSGDAFPQYEVVVSPDSSTPNRFVLFRVLPSILANAITGGKIGGKEGLLQQVREMQKLHGETLEGLGQLRHGINLKIR